MGHRDEATSWLLAVAVVAQIGTVSLCRGGDRWQHLGSPRRADLS